MMRFYLIRFPLFAFVVLAVLSSGCGSSKRASETQGSERPASSSAKDAGVPSEDGRRVIAALGDSLTAGLGVDPADNYPSKLQRRLDAGSNKYRVVNAGVSGDTSAQGLSRLASVRALRPEFVILALGANDGLRGLPIESTRKNLETIITELQRDGTRVVLAGMMIPPNYGPEYARAFRDVFPELAKKYRIPLIPFLLQGVAGDPVLNQPDGVHPTAQGYDIVADNVWRVLKPLLKEE
ncbi:MAG: arylesterase [Acidobacteria bacterium]|nr:MAG: arylesterase [Acidobacteriota bacterium]